jgi:hypothetical protein
MTSIFKIQSNTPTAQSPAAVTRWRPNQPPRPTPRAPSWRRRPAFFENPVYHEQTQSPNRPNRGQTGHSMAVGRISTPLGDWLCLGLLRPEIGFQLALDWLLSPETQKSENAKRSEPDIGQIRTFLALFGAHRCCRTQGTGRVMRIRT